MISTLSARLILIMINPEVIEEKYLFTQKEGKWVNGLKWVYTQDSKGVGHLRSEKTIRLSILTGTGINLRMISVLMITR